MRNPRVLSAGPAGWNHALPPVALCDRRSNTPSKRPAVPEILAGPGSRLPIGAGTGVLPSGAQGNGARQLNELGVAVAISPPTSCTQWAEKSHG